MNKSVAVRQSQGEWVRLVAMLLIVAHHFAVHALYPEVLSFDIRGHDWDSAVVLGLHAFIYVGVNMFVLLSGWYGIKCRPRGIVKLWSVMFFYAALFAVMHLVAIHFGVARRPTFGWFDIERVIFPLSHSRYWFITCYLGLMFLSPILNAAVRSMSRRELGITIVLLMVLNLWFGWLWGVDKINSSGYTLMQFIWIYMLGGWLHKDVGQQWIEANRKPMFWMYVICCALWGLTAVGSVYLGLPKLTDRLHLFTYCNPLIVGGAVGLFLFIMSRPVQQPAVNYWAASTLGVYLLQESFVPYGQVGALTEVWHPAARLVALVVLSLVFFPLALLFDKCRAWLMRPFWRFYDKRISGAISRMTSRLRF